MNHEWRRRSPGLQPWPCLVFLLAWLCALGTLYQLDNKGLKLDEGFRAAPREGAEAEGSSAPLGSQSSALG